MFTYSFITVEYLERAVPVAMESLREMLNKDYIDVIRVTITKMPHDRRKVTIVFNL